MSEKKQAKVTIGVDLDKDLHTKLKKFAKSEDLNISQVVRKLVREYVATKEAAK